MNVVAHKGASLVGLTLDVHVIEAFIQCPVERPVFPVETSFHCCLKFPDLLLLQVTN